MLETNETLDIKIIDFGMATYYDPEELIEISCGTLPYKAPELHRHDKYDEKVDIWAIGVIAFILMYGKMPFPGESK